MRTDNEPITEDRTGGAAESEPVLPQTAEPVPRRRDREKRGLGRGLGALLGDVNHADAADRRNESVESRRGAGATGSQGIEDVDSAPMMASLAEIALNPYQPRTAFDPVKLRELADSIQAHGVLQPLIVRRLERGYQLVSGERRWRAAQLAGLDEAPIVVRRFTDREALEVALVENIQREDIGPLEAAAAYRRLSDEFHMTQEEIAVRVGRSRSAVANAMRLLNLPDEMRESLAAGRITEGHARALLGIADAKDRERAWKRILTTGGSVRDAETAARQSRDDPAGGGLQTKRREGGRPAGNRSIDPNLQEVESRLRGRLGTRVEIAPDAGGGGRLSIEYYGADDLNRLLDLLLPDGDSCP